jgi:hypothetical protein
VTYGLTDVIAHLYTVPPDEFIAERAVAVDRAKAAGDRALAGQIAKLRKPSLAAWLVNLLSHQRPHLIGELFALGAELRDAQRELRGAELRELSLRRRATVAALVKEARELAVGAGRPVREKLPLAEVEQTLTAALADGYLAEEVRAGRLTKPLEYAGFGETPRPRLRLVHGGRATAPPAPPAPPAPKTRTIEKRISSAAEERQRRAEEARIVAERKAAMERARAMKAARRELLAASLQLVNAQAAREKAAKALAAAEEAMAEAEQRAELAKAEMEKFSSEGG